MRLESLMLITQWYADFKAYDCLAFPSFCNQLSLLSFVLEGQKNHGNSIKCKEGGLQWVGKVGRKHCSLFWKSEWHGWIVIPLFVACYWMFDSEEHLKWRTCMLILKWYSPSVIMQYDISEYIATKLVGKALERVAFIHGLYKHSSRSGSVSRGKTKKHLPWPAPGSRPTANWSSLSSVVAVSLM